MKQNTTTKQNAITKQNLNERTQTLIDFDNEIRSEFPGTLCGVDEAGRGPIAGPVVAAAVMFSNDIFIDGVFDSKQVSRKKRELLFDEITGLAFSYGVGIIHSGEIDRMNILNATKEAMNIAVSKLAEMPGIIIADGKFYEHPETQVKNIVKADEKSFCVAAASIIAKVTRDSIMREYQNQYPNFTFSAHKGYGTTMHIDEIIEHGYTEIHRRTFKLKAMQGILF